VISLTTGAFLGMFFVRVIVPLVADRSFGAVVEVAGEIEGAYERHDRYTCCGAVAGRLGHGAYNAADGCIDYIVYCYRRCC
jgi:hypothetical protein